MLRVLPVLFLIFALLTGHAQTTASAPPAPLPVTDFSKFLVPGEYRATLPVDGRDRQFILITPPGLSPGERLPLVFFFHGAGGSAEQAAITYGWVEKARAKKFFLIFPQGLGANPNAVSSFLSNPNIWRDERSGRQGPVDDVHFFETLLHEATTRLPVDPARVFVTGFSNGAAMTFTVGARFSDRLAAIAPVASQSFVHIDKLARPVPVYFIAGTSDPLIPYHGGSVMLPWGQTPAWPAVQDSVDAWARLDGCPPQPAVTEAGGVRVAHYGPSRGGGEVIFTTIEGNGHHWPGSVEPLPLFISGPTLDPFSATDRIWEFFAQHPLRTAAP